MQAKSLAGPTKTEPIIKPSLNIEDLPVTSTGNKESWLDFIRVKFVAITDRLFGPTDVPVEMNRRAYLIYIAVVAILTILQVLRRPDALTNPQFFAEDGQIFFIDRFLNGPIQSIFIGVNSFPYLLQRLVAEAAVPFGVANAPLIYSLFAIIVNSFASACFSLPHFRHIVRTDYLRIIFCLVIVSLPDTAPLVNELSHISWWLAVWSVLICLIQLPRSRLGLGLLVVAFFVAAFTAPVTLLTAPIWFARLCRAGLVRRYRELLLCIAALGFIVAIIFITGNLGARENSHFELLSAINLISTRIVTTATLGFGSMSSWVIAGNGPIAYLLTAVVVVSLLAAALVWRLRILPVLLFCFYCTFSSITLLLLGRGGWGTDWTSLNPAYIFEYLSSGSRYFVIGNTLIYLAFFVVLDRLQFWGAIPRSGLKVGLPLQKSGNLEKSAISGAILKIVMGLTISLVIFHAVAQTFIVAPYINLDWKKYAAQIQNNLDTGNRTPIRVPLNPDPQFWFFVTANLAYSQEVKIAPDTVLGEINGDKEVSQSFLSKCEDLSVVRLTLTTYGREVFQPVNFRLKDAATQQVLVEQTLPVKDIQNNFLQSFYFAPIAGSNNKKYIFNISMPGSQPGAGIGVSGSNSDSYSGGEAQLSSVSTQGDLAFDYGCEKK